MPFLIDGYNVYHAACKFCQDWSHITPGNLCRLIAEDMGGLGDIATVVFDGAQPRGWSPDAVVENRLKILYSGPKSDADTLLITLIQKNTAPRRLIVVSSDNSIRRAARRRKSLSLTAMDYLAGLIKRQEKPPPRPREPKEKHKGLAEGELAEWLELFGIDPSEPPDDFDRINF